MAAPSGPDKGMGFFPDRAIARMALCRLPSLKRVPLPRIVAIASPGKSARRYGAISPIAAARAPWVAPLSASEASSPIDGPNRFALAKARMALYRLPSDKVFSGPRINSASWPLRSALNKVANSPIEAARNPWVAPCKIICPSVPDSGVRICPLRAMDKIAL